jgi:hypothetical protein
MNPKSSLEVEILSLKVQVYDILVERHARFLTRRKEHPRVFAQYSNRIKPLLDAIAVLEQARYGNR